MLAGEAKTSRLAGGDPSPAKPSKPRLQYITESVADDHGLFGGLDVGDVQRITWRDQDDPSHFGRIWTAVAADGLGWVADGAERIAAVPARMFRFFRNGIASRRELVTERYLKGLVPIHPGALCINVGANIGEVALTLADRGASVIAIEPDPGVLPALNANAAGRAIEVVPVAAWNANGHVAMRIATETADTSAFWDAPASQGAMHPSRRIDTLIAERGIARVHLICGDAEGAEPEVLEGACETLKTTSYVSLCASAERCGERTLEACEALLAGAGFDIIYREDSGFCMLIGKSRSA
jgi:FkbM family methyltransferase